ncbi:MAG: hypothetical protein JXR91_11075 [Deltaproteobacteria bacterium]|nr:hypothetical protein [Deltaproteobacteria bacterium]
MTFLTSIQLSGKKTWQPCRFISYYVVLMFAMLPATAPVNALQITNTQPIPKIIMLDVKGVTPYSMELYHSMRAQLSASPLTLERIELPNSDIFTSDPLKSAANIARQNNASMVFWIEDKKTCHLYFYLPDKENSSIRSRTLNLKLNNPWSRFQVISIAAASMIEGFLVSNQLNPTPPPVPPSVPEPKQNAESNKKVKNLPMFELSTAYSGRLLANKLFTNGIAIGVGRKLNRHLVASFSFASNFPAVIENSDYRLSISSKIIEISAAARWMPGIMDIRLGIAWSMNLQSFSTTTHTQSIIPVSNGLKRINVLSSFLSVSWINSRNLGLFIRVGANFPLNDTIYSINRIEGNSAEVVPYRIQPLFMSGFIILI